MPGPVDQDGRRGLLGLDYGRRPWSVWAEALRGWRAVTEPLPSRARLTPMYPSEEFCRR